MTREELIVENKAIFWDIPDSKSGNISDEVLLERFLNYSKDMKSVSQLIDILGFKQAENIFQKIANSPRKRISEKTRNYFEKYFVAYAPINT